MFEANHPDRGRSRAASRLRAPRTAALGLDSPLREPLQRPVEIVDADRDVAVALPRSYVRPSWLYVSSSTESWSPSEKK